MGDKRRRLMRTGEVAALFRVDIRTVSRWAKSGRLPAIRTPGGQFRFDRAEVEKFMPPAAAS